MGFSRISTVTSFSKLMLGIRINPIKYKTQDIKSNRFTKRLSYEDSILNLGMEIAESINYANSVKYLDVYNDGYLCKRKFTINYYNEKFIDNCMNQLKLNGVWYRKADNPVQAWFIDSYRKGIFLNIYNSISKGVEKDETKSTSTDKKESKGNTERSGNNTTDNSSSSVDGSPSNIDAMIEDNEKRLYPNEK